MKRLLFLVLGVVLTGALLIPGWQDEARSDRPTHELEAEYQAHARRAAARDAFPVLHNPEMSSAEEADRRLSPRDWVLGVSIHGASRAYPISVMGVHELVNDVVGGTPVAVCW